MGKGSNMRCGVFRKKTLAPRLVNRKFQKANKFKIKKPQNLTSPPWDPSVIKFLKNPTSPFSFNSRKTGQIYPFQTAFRPLLEQKWPFLTLISFPDADQLKYEKRSKYVVRACVYCGMKKNSTVSSQQDSRTSCFRNTTRNGQATVLIEKTIFLRV